MDHFLNTPATRATMAWKASFGALVSKRKLRKEDRNEPQVFSFNWCCCRDSRRVDVRTIGHGPSSLSQQAHPGVEDLDSATNLVRSARFAGNLVERHHYAYGKAR